MTATGLAPMVKMSRKIPPTPVVAPWKGSMNEGWLCDSILKAHAQPSPMSMIPAFSPGPCKTNLLRVGNRFRWTRDDLYEQCSLHITLKMPSSVSVGSRPPRSCLIFSYSSGVRPCWRSISGEKAEVKEVAMGRVSIVAFQTPPGVEERGCDPTFLWTFKLTLPL